MSNLEKLKNAYQIWNDEKGLNQNCWLDIFCEEVVLYSVDENTPNMAFAKNRYSKSEAVLYLTGLLKDWDMVHWTPDTYIENGEQVAMFGRCQWTSKQTGKTTEVDIAHLIEFRNGLIVSIREIFDSAKVLLAATK